MLTAIVFGDFNCYAFRQHAGLRQQHLIRVLAELYLEVCKRTRYVLFEGDVLQHGFLRAGTGNIDIVLLGCQFYNLESVLGLCTGYGYFCPDFFCGSLSGCGLAFPCRDSH